MAAVPGSATISSVAAAKVGGVARGVEDIVKAITREVSFGLGGC